MISWCGKKMTYAWVCLYRHYFFSSTPTSISLDKIWYLNLYKKKWRVVCKRKTILTFEAFGEWNRSKAMGSMPFSHSTTPKETRPLEKVQGFWYHHFIYSHKLQIWCGMNAPPKPFSPTTLASLAPPYYLDTLGYFFYFFFIFYIYKSIVLYVVVSECNDKNGNLLYDFGFYAAWSHTCHLNWSPLCCHNRACHIFKALPCVF